MDWRISSPVLLFPFQFQIPDSSSKNLVYILPTGIYSGRAPSRSANVSGLKALGPGFVLFDVTHDQGAHVISR